MTTGNKTHSTAFDEIQRLASDSAGYFVRRQLPKRLKYAVQYHEAQGRLQRVARGIYRLTAYPPNQDEDYIVAYLWSDGRGVISEESALAIHGLSDVLPVATVLTVVGRTNQVPPDGVRLVHRAAPYPADALTWHGAVQVTTPLQTLCDLALRGVEPQLFEQAVEDAIARGTLSADVWKDLLLMVVDR